MTSPTETAPRPAESADQIGAPARRVTDDFDAFRAAQTPKPDRPHVRIKGLEVPIPSGDDLPATLLYADIGTLNAPDLAIIKQIVDAAYGVAVRDEWLARGMSISDMMVVVAWTMARVDGSGITFAEAAATLDDSQEKRAAEHTARQQRDRALGAAAAGAHNDPVAAAAHAAAVEEAGKALSSGGGPLSRPTSDVSTASVPPSSPGWAPGSSGFYSVV